MFERFTDQARRVVVHAQEEARRLRQGQIGVEHLVLGLIEEGSGIGGRALAEVGIIQSDAREATVRVRGQSEQEVSGHIPFLPQAKKALELSLREALQLGHNYIGTEHILLGITRETSLIADLLRELGKDPAAEVDRIRKVVLTLLGEEKKSASTGTNVPVTQSKSSGKQTILDQFGTNLTQRAREGELEPVIGRDREIARCEQILSRHRKNNPVLIGEPGVGKTAIVEGLAQRIVAGEVVEDLLSKELYTLDLGQMVAGSRYRGDFEERLKKTLKAVQDHGNIILFMDEIHTLVGAGAAEGAIDAANMLKPMLARGDIQMVGATTETEYRKYLEKDSALERRFLPVRVDEPDVADTINILEGIRLVYEAAHRVRYTEEAIVAAARLSHRHISDRFLPDKAIDLVDEAGAYVKTHRLGYHEDLEANDAAYFKLAEEQRFAVLERDWTRAAELDEALVANKQTRRDIQARLEAAGETLETVVDVRHIQHVLSVWTGIPAERFTVEEAERLNNMEQELHKRVIGQHAAIVAVAKAVRRSRAGLKDPKRPAGSFMFLGPSGVGKTELAKALAEFLFSDEDAMITIDMSEYMEKHSVSRLVGAPPGYVGYDEGGQLTEAVRRKPFSVVLLDEIEKAHPDVWNILLQLFEEGKLTDGQGRTTNFKECVIIMTGNLGTEQLKHQAVGFATEDPERSYERLKEVVLEEVKKRMRPEFINRIDEIVVFDNLSEEEIVQIVDLEIDKLEELLKDSANDVSNVELTPEAKAKLAEWGYDDASGARELKRVIQKRIVDPLAEMILAGELGDTVTAVVDYDADVDGLLISANDDIVEEIIEEVQRNGSSVQDEDDAEDDTSAADDS